MDTNQNTDDIDIIYQPVDNPEGKIRIFGQNFVKNNKDKCKIILNEEEYELKEYFEDIDQNYNHKDLIKIKLRGFNNITDMSFMFSDCNSIKSINNLSGLDDSQIVSIKNSVDNIKWNTSNITNMSSVFDSCELLEFLPDISKWNTSKVNNMESMFNACYSLPFYNKKIALILQFFNCYIIHFH